MKKISLEKICTDIFCVLAILVFALLFGLSISSSWVNDWDLVSEYVSPVRDSLPGNLLWMLGLLVLGCLLYRLGRRFPSRINMDIIAAIVSLMAFAFSVYWVSASNTAPQADQLGVCSYAEAFDLGDVSGLNKGAYIGINPQQLGLLSFIRVLYRLFGAGNYRAYQYFNAWMVPVLIFSGYQIVKKLSRGSSAAGAIYLFLMAVCVPLYCYVPFVYGEISSTAMVMLAAWMFLTYQEQAEGRTWKGIVCLTVMSLSMGAAVLFRQNALIFLIAFLVVIAVRLFHKGGRKRLLLSAGGLLAGVLLFQGALQVVYRPVTPQDSHGMPAVLYVAMGVNDDNGRAGWHNWYNMVTFAENDHDVQKASAAAWEDLGEFAGKCLADPAYALDFYYRKISSQWNVPMYQCLAMNSLIAGEQSRLAESVYFGELREWLEREMNLYQLLVYGGILVLLVFGGRKQNITYYLLLVGVFGGFLFSLLWEAKSRYVFPYFVMMIPNAALGIHFCVEWLSKKLTRQQ